MKTRHRYSVADHAVTVDGERYDCATTSEDDPCVVVTVREGERHYRYSMSAVAVTARHRRAAAAAIAAYERQAVR